MRHRFRLFNALGLSLLLALLSGCVNNPPVTNNTAVETPAEDSGDTLVIYSGRGEDLVGPVIEQFESTSGFDVEVRYGDTAEMAATILEEGNNSPADVFFAQDAGALGALTEAGRTTALPEELTGLVDSRFRSPTDHWVGITGRARVVVYNTANLSESLLPAEIYGFCDETWKGRLGWAPTNGSFQAFVTALRITEGEDRAREWLECILANEVREYPKNTSIVEAAASGEIDAGFVNHYYLYRFLDENPDFGARNYHLPEGDAGAMVNIAGAAIVDTTDNPKAALAFIEHLLGANGQRYFADETSEYPLIDSVETRPELKPLSGINTPEMDLSNLDDLEGTLTLLRDIGAL